jgi:uncharacterized Tic20 family protein
MTEPPRPPGDDPTNPYQPPYSGGYPPPPPPPPHGQPPYGYGYQQDPAQDRLWILVTHFGGAAGALFGAGMLGWVAPLVALVARGNQSPPVRAEAVKGLNFHLLWGIIALVGSVLTCIGIGVLILGAATLVATIVGIVAGVKAANGEPFDYPLSARFLR